MRRRMGSVIEAGLAALGLSAGAWAQPVALAQPAAPVQPLAPSAQVLRLDFGRLDQPLDLGVDFAASDADAGARPLLGSIEAFRIGWRYRPCSPSDWGGARPELRALADRPVTRVGIQWKSAPSQIDFLRGGIGLRLDGAEHLSIRLRKGSFGIYLKRSF